MDTIKVTLNTSISDWDIDQLAAYFDNKGFLVVEADHENDLLMIDTTLHYSNAYSALTAILKVLEDDADWDTDHHDESDEPSALTLQIVQ